MRDERDLAQARYSMLKQHGSVQQHPQNSGGAIFGQVLGNSFAISTGQER